MSALDWSGQLQWREAPPRPCLPPACPCGPETGGRRRRRSLHTDAAPRQTAYQTPDWTCPTRWDRLPPSIRQCECPGPGFSGCAGVHRECGLDREAWVNVFPVGDRHSRQFACETEPQGYRKTCGCFALKADQPLSALSRAMQVFSPAAAWILGNNASRSS